MRLHKRIVRKLVGAIVRKLERRVFWSKTLRNMYLEYFSVQVGVGTYGAFSIYANEGSTIGNYTSIAPGVRVVNNHNIGWASTHPLFYDPDFGFSKGTSIKYHPISIGHDVWIGANTLITNGCTKIGNGAVIAAGSVVTKDVEPYSVVAGVPAKLVKMRFDYDAIYKLEESQWFMKSPEVLYRFSEIVTDPLKFAEEIMKEGNYEYSCTQRNVGNNRRKEYSRCNKKSG